MSRQPRPLQSIDCIFDAGEAAAYLRTTKGAIHNLVYRKRLPAYKPFGKLLFKKSELDRCIEFSKKEIRNGNY